MGIIWSAISRDVIIYEFKVDLIEFDYLREKMLGSSASNSWMRVFPMSNASSNTISISDLVVAVRDILSLVKIKSSGSDKTLYKLKFRWGDGLPYSVSSGISGCKTEDYFISIDAGVGVCKMTRYRIVEKEMITIDEIDLRNISSINTDQFGKVQIVKKENLNIIRELKVAEKRLRRFTEETSVIVVLS